MTWPVPQGWGHETIPFPLDFAPELKHEGVEELRFMPGFFDPASPNRWSYAFVWTLEDPAPPTRAQLEQELALYYKGLCTQVGSKKGFKMDPIHFRCHLEGRGGAFQGQAAIYDAFRTGEALNLYLRIHTWKGKAHRFIAVAASPKDFQSEPWPMLDACVAQALETKTNP